MIFLQKKQSKRTSSNSNLPGKKFPKSKSKPSPSVQKLITETPAYVDGFHKGFNSGYDSGYSKGFREGEYAGGDGIVDKCLLEHQILPEITAKQIITAGIEHYRSNMIHLKSAREIGERIVAALDSNTPLSLVRLGDGELLTLAQESVLTIDKVKEEGAILPYAGVQVPDLAVKEQLIRAIRRASIVGIPKMRETNFQPLAFAVFRAENIVYHSLTLTDSLINYKLYDEGYLSRITQGRRVLLIGNLAPQLAEILHSHGVFVAGEISPVEGVKDIENVMDTVGGYDFDIALVSAGISAVILAQRIAREYGKIAVDFGHLADYLVKGEVVYR